MENYSRSGCHPGAANQGSTKQNRSSLPGQTLDRKIGEDLWETHTKWLDGKECLSIKLLASQKADTKYPENANLILELSKKTLELFQIQNAEQKRRLLNLLVSNCSYKNENIDVVLKPVFNKILKTTKTRNWCAR